MKAYVFPGQGAQFPGMGKDLYETSAEAKQLFDNANEILGFSITDIMFGEDAEALKKNKSNTTCYLFAFCNFSKSIRNIFYARNGCRAFLR
jgi:[acyl-carrier-protein] S-malonyltransferase